MTTKNNNENINLYAGDIPKNTDLYNNYLGLSLHQENEKHIKWDLTKLPFPFEDNSINIFQSEDVFEHINYNNLGSIIDEIYRILKPTALFRLSMPDYNCDILYKRSFYDYNGNLVYDPGGGGTFENPGHVWFPTYDKVKKLIDVTKFGKNGKVEYLQYYISKKKFVLSNIDYSKGYIQRTPDNDKRVQNPRRPMSIVVDLYKGEK